MNKINFFIIPFIFLIIQPVEILVSNYQEEPIVDSNLQFEEIFINYKLPEQIKSSLKLLSVEYFSFDNKLHLGQILIHKDLAKDLLEIFEIIKQKRFPISKVIPISKYNWSDELSIKDNNTSAFNYRYVKGTKALSSHALGRAIDINPKLNPQIGNGTSDSKYNIDLQGTIAANSFLVKEFTKRGWQWGGFWKRTKDYQHFEKLK